MTSKKKLKASKNAVDAIVKTDTAQTAENVTEAPTQEAEQKVPDPALRSVITKEGFVVGIVLGEGYREDGTFDMNHGLLYTNIDLAIGQLESVITHARQYQAQKLFDQGVEHGKRISVMESSPARVVEDESEQEPKSASGKKKK